ncbi:MAG: glycosyltransferase [Anaerolineaceae bacterium]|nr:glycosyltransferase [Anaerolineaceae bacterium]
MTVENKEKNFVSAVVYVHNAADRITNFLSMLIRVMETNFENSEIICVNDCSEDNSAEVIKTISKTAKSTAISIINLSFFHGLELAMGAGVDLAIGDFVFEFDNSFADFDESMIMAVYRRSLEGFDIVSASPDKKEKLTSRLFYYLFQRYSSNHYTMTSESFRILSRRLINRINAMNRTVPYRKAIYAGSGFKMDNLRYPIQEHNTQTQDRREKTYRWDLAIDSLILFTELGYRFSMAMTGVMMAVAVFMLLYSVITYLLIHPVAGWTTTILFLSVAFLGLFGILTIIIKYLQIILNLLFKRKRYSFESIEKLTK